MHIRVEHQMRLHIENLQQKIEDLERENDSDVRIIKVENKELRLEKKRLNELLNMKDEQIEHSKRLSNDANAVEKIRSKFKVMEGHYETKIQELMDELNGYKKASKIIKTKSCLKKEGSKSSNALRKSSTKYKGDNCMSSSTFGKAPEPDSNYKLDIEYDTDISPADELNTSDHLRMIQNAENIGNDSLLINFYKKKLEDQQISDKLSQRQLQNYTHRESAPLKERDENSAREDESIRMNNLYMQSSSQRQINGYVPKHYQIPKKDGSINLETQGTTGTDISENLKKMYRQIK